MIDNRAAERIVAAAELEPGSRVVEIGPGLGALTFPLLHAGVDILALEADRSMIGALTDRLGSKYRDRVEFIHGNALNFDFTALPRGTVVLGNLPYHVSSQLIFKMMAAHPAVDRAVVTIQKELAERILSPPGPKAYGRISVKIRAQTKLTSVMTLKPGAFFPPPKVSSQTIRLDFGQPPPLEIISREMFEKVVLAAFAQRRKTLRRALLAAPLGIDKETWEEVFQAAGIDPGLRAEKLSLEDFIRLANQAGEAAAS